MFGIKIIDFELGKEEGEIVFFLGEDDLTDWWGESWHKCYGNALRVSDEYIAGRSTRKVFSWMELFTVEDGYEYRCSKEEMKNGLVPCAIVAPVGKANNFAQASLVKDCKKVFFGDRMVPDELVVERILQIKKGNLIIQSAKILKWGPAPRPSLQEGKVIGLADIAFAGLSEELIVKDEIWCRNCPYQLLVCQNLMGFATRDERDFGAAFSSYKTKKYGRPCLDIPGQRISEICPYYPDKGKCWQEFYAFMTERVKLNIE